MLNIIGREDEDPPVFVAVSTIFSPNVSSGDRFVKVTDGRGVRELSMEGDIDTPLRVNVYAVAPTPPVHCRVNPDTLFSVDDVI